MDFWDVIEGRHSVRDFQPREVPQEVLERALSAAAAAPSALNAQPWRYHVCTGQARQRVGEAVAQATVHLAEYVDMLGPKHYEDAVKWYSSLGDAPVAIVFSAPRSANGSETVNKLLSMGASIENLLLAFTALGLGACNITFAAYVKSELAQIIGLSDDREVLGIIVAGYPTDVAPSAPPRERDVADWVE